MKHAEPVGKRRLHKEGMSGQPMLPNLIVPGAQKSGTSALHQYLRAHPQCVMSSPKEPHFFTRGFSRSDIDEYRKCFADRDGKQDVRTVGESSTTYLSNPNVPARIRETLGGDVRVVIMLRNPVERAVSAYWHMHKRGEERTIHEALSPESPNLENAVASEFDSVQAADRSETIDTKTSNDAIGDRHFNFRYLRNSCYLDDLRRYTATFGSERIMVVLLEDLAAEPVGEFRRITKFLELDDIVPACVGVRIKETRVSRRGRIMSTAHQVARSLPGRALSVIRPSLMRLTSLPRPTTPRPIRASLESLFAPHNIELSSYLGIDLQKRWRVAK
jgi:hypothetical protein